MTPPLPRSSSFAHPTWRRLRRQPIVWEDATAGKHTALRRILCRDRKEATATSLWCSPAPANRPCRTPACHRPSASPGNDEPHQRRAHLLSPRHHRGPFSACRSMISSATPRRNGAAGSARRPIAWHAVAAPYSLICARRGTDARARRAANIRRSGAERNICSATLRYLLVKEWTAGSVGRLSRSGARSRWCRLKPRPAC